jgi:SAM-dependent methyltransferase
MLSKVLGIAFIVLGVIGMIVPIMPCIPFLLVGFLLLYKDRLAELRHNLPEEMPALVAQAYGTFIAKVFTPYHKMICAQISLSKGDTLLDLGTGPGTLPIEIAKRFPDSKIIGIDLSKKMIEIAEENRVKGPGAGVQELNNLKFQVMDAKALQLPDNSIDMVISTGSMHHWKDRVKIFDEIFRVLKPGCEAWIYDGYGNASDEDINSQMNKFLGFLPTPWLARKVLAIHGYTQREYDTMIKESALKSRFGTCSLDKAGIMMRVRLSKPR